jgi:hypothetical protein
MIFYITFNFIAIAIAIAMVGCWTYIVIVGIVLILLLCLISSPLQSPIIYNLHDMPHYIHPHVLSSFHPACPFPLIIFGGLLLFYLSFFIYIYFVSTNLFSLFALSWFTFMQYSCICPMRSILDSICW